MIGLEFSFNLKSIPFQKSEVDPSVQVDEAQPPPIMLKDVENIGVLIKQLDNCNW